MAGAVAARPFLSQVVAMSPRRRILAGAVVAFGNFMVVLDLTIANVSVPTISGTLGTSLNQGTWIVTSYAVAEAICVPMAGWLAQRFGAVRMFLAALFGFALFSLLCGLSVSLGMLVACRIGQGFCGGPIMPMSQTLMARIFPPEQRAQAIALWAMTVTMGPAMGPILGGYITENYSWHWIFLINVPLGAACCVAGYALLRRVETPRLRVPIDKLGLALLVLWIGCLQIMLDIGHDRDWFADPLVDALGVGAVVGFLLWLIWELTEEHPLVDLRIFRHRGYRAAVATMALCYGSFFAGLVVVPQWMQVTLGYPAGTSGLVSASSSAGSVMVAPLVARLTPRVDGRILVFGGVMWLALMSLWRVSWTGDADFASYALPMFCQGLAIPFIMIPLTGIIQASVSPGELASGAGLQNFARTLAIAVSTSLILTAWSDAQAIARTKLAGLANPGLLQDSMARAGLGADQVPGMLSGLLDREVITIGVNYTFLISTVALLLGGALVWTIPRVDQRPGAAPPGGH